MAPGVEKSEEGPATDEQAATATGDCGSGVGMLALPGVERPRAAPAMPGVLPRSVAVFGTQFMGDLAGDLAGDRVGASSGRPRAAAAASGSPIMRRVAAWAEVTLASEVRSWRASIDACASSPS